MNMLPSRIVAWITMNMLESASDPGGFRAETGRNLLGAVERMARQRPDGTDGRERLRVVESPPSQSISPETSRATAI